MQVLVLLLRYPKQPMLPLRRSVQLNLAASFAIADSPKVTVAAVLVVLLTLECVARQTKQTDINMLLREESVPYFRG